MIIDELIQRSSMWLSPKRDQGIVISSRIRLARNIDGVAFPGWAGVDEAKRLFEVLSGVLENHNLLGDPVVVPFDGLSAVDKEVLRERRLISPEFAGKGAGCGLVVADKQKVAVMINEEDHLRMQIMRPGLDLVSAWDLMTRVDTELERHVNFAFSSELGYLTACPSNVGTGMRASVMLHLPGLKLLDELERVAKGLNRMGLAVRGTFGEGSEAFGNLVQISNQVTLGVDETQTIARVQDIAETLVSLERNARARLMELREVQLRDFVCRALGILKYAQIISSQEALDLLSALRLGLEMGMLSGVLLNRVNELILMIQPGHMQKSAGRMLSTDDRDALRMDIMRETLNGIERVSPA